MLKVTRADDRIRVETGTVIFEWDLTRGGQIVRCDLKGCDTRHSLLTGDEPVPNLKLDLGDRVVSFADSPVEVSFSREDDECVIFTTKSDLAELFDVEQQFEVFREGIVFCTFFMILKNGKKTTVRNAEMNFPLDVASAKNMRSNYVTRDPYIKQDATIIHVLTQTKVCIERDAEIDFDQLLAMFGLDLGWEESRYFSNRVEMVIEDSTSIGEEMYGKVRTIAGPSDDGWRR